MMKRIPALALSSLLNKGDWLRTDCANTAKNGCRKAPVLLIQQAVTTVMSLAVCAVLSMSPAAAEPILGEESISVPSGNAAQKSEATDALALFKARDFEGSLRLWKEAAKKNVDMPPAQVIMAQLFLQANMFKESQEALNQAIVDAPGDPEPYMIMAGIAMRDRDLAKAESLFQKASGLLSAFDKSAKRKESLQVLFYGGMAAVAEARKDWAGAQKSLDALTKLDPKNIAARQRLAYCAFQQKNAEGALEILRETTKADPAASIPEIVLAQFYQRVGDLENVKKWMDAALKAAPKNLKTRLAAGYCALEMGRMDEAQKHAIAAMQIDQKSFEAKMLRGLITVCQRDYVAAELFFGSALQQSPDDFVASNNLALALIEQNDPAKTRRALEYAEVNARKYPKSASAASTYGWVLYRTGRLDEAEKALRTAAAAGPMSIDTAYYTARVLVDRDRKADARQLLENALKGTGLSMCRQEAEDLLEQLKK
jgi:Tfp pilus assembly protein PilF